jgi:hypothetical protein
MADAFSSCEITPIGISVKVGTHRSALGIKDFATPEDFQAAVAAKLESVLGKNLAVIAAALAAKEDDKAQAIAALEADHAAKIIALEADIATLGTKAEAMALRKAQERTRDLEQLAALTAKLRVPVEAEPADAPR